MFHVHLRSLIVGKLAALSFALTLPKSDDEVA
jgi:hypothetical protein